MWERGTRRGTLALLVFSIVTFSASVILPFLTQPTFEPPKSSDSFRSGDTASRKPGSTLWSRLQHPATTLLHHLRIPGLTLRRAWFLSHLLFALCMFLTFIVRSVILATVLVALIGIPWAVTMWVPFALIADDISKRDAIRRGLIRARTREAELLARGEAADEDQAGVVLGIHNVSISAPQVLSTVISSLIFRIAAKPRGMPGDESVAWCLRFGGVCAIVAAWLTTRVEEESADVLRETEQHLESGNEQERDYGEDE